MGYRWFQNFFQYPLENSFSDKEMQNIPYPYVELGIHVTLKNVQTGSFVGGWILPAIIHQFDKTTTFKNKIKLYTRYGVLIGFISGPVLSFARVKQANISREAAIERCYRLRYNKRQLFIDRSSIVAAALGFYGARWFGFANSVNGIIVVGTIYNKFFWHLVPRRFHDMCEEPPFNKPSERSL